MDAPVTGFQWKNRRRWLWVVSVFNMAVISYILWVGSDARIYETGLTAAFSLLGLLGGSYVFGAAWEHRSLAAGVTRQPPEQS